MAVYLDDLPSVPPRFGFDLIGSALADVLLQPSEGATVVGIHGPWGSGKTTLMYAVRDALANDLGEGLLIVVDFNAWKYHAREALWRALILRIVGELRVHGESPHKLQEIEDSLYRAFEINETGPWSVNWRSAATEAASIALSVLQLGFAGRLVRGIVGVKASGDEGIIGKEDAEALGGILERETVSRHVAQVQSIEQFLDAFKDLIAELRATGRQVVVLIDDLDRCLPEAALEIFEAIKLFLDAPGVGFVVAVDRDVIKKGLAVRYGTPETAQPLVNPDEYIEKTIALSYDVPRLSVADVDVLITEAALPFELRTDHRALVLAGLGANPRRVKRFLNLVRLQMALAERVSAQQLPIPNALKSDAAPVSVGILIKTMLIGYRYSTLLQTGADHPTLLFDLQGIATAYRNTASTDVDGAKRTRKEELDGMPQEIAALDQQEPFWTLMAAGPDLASHRTAVRELADWFRGSRVQVDSG